MLTSWQQVVANNLHKFKQVGYAIEQAAPHSGNCSHYFSVFLYLSFALQGGYYPAIMKENDYKPKPAAANRPPAVEFLLFLLEPEDTGRTAALYGRRQRHTRFDNRLGGTIKIFFWFCMAILFWGGFPDLCALFAKGLQRW